MLDALEWTVNKTPLGDARLSARAVDEKPVTEDENAPGQMPGEVERVGDDDRRVAPPALLPQPSSEPRELERREIGEVEEVQRRLGRRGAPPEVVAAQVMLGAPRASLTRFVAEAANDSLVRREEAGNAQQKRRAPRPERANYGRDLTAFEVQVHAAQNGIRREARPSAGREPLMKTDHLERERHAHR